MYIGKLATEDLNQLVLSKIKNHRSTTKMGPGVGLDVAYLQFGEKLMAVASDPITGAGKNIGSLALLIACNDISAGGGEPLAVMITMLLPPHIKKEEIAEIMEDAQTMATKLNVDILGGHTEVTTAVNRVVLSLTALGRVERPLKGIQENDAIVMTKSLGLEGVSIIVAEKEEIRAHLTKEEIEDAQQMGQQLSIAKEARIGLDHGVNFMHDITEGGLVGALSEMCFESNLGFFVDSKKVPIHDVTHKVSDFYDIDPFQLISSGSLLMTLPKEEVEGLLQELSAKGIEASHIGEFRTDQRKILRFDQDVEVEMKAGDELYKVMG
ncbi:MAG TPA: AIR synthase family protein [Clostridia bacterium]|nr:AIR synthase family protein [Clostridia bacterium]